MKVHSLLKSLNAIDEEMIAEADRFAVKRREQLKSRQHIFVTEVTAVAAIAIAVAGVFFFSLQPGHTPQKQSGQNGVLLDDTQTKTTAKAVATAIIHSGVSIGTIIGINIPETRKPS